MNFYKIFREGC